MGFIEFMAHQYVLTVIAAFFFTVLLKGILISIREKKLVLNRGLRNGGMPSSHTASIAALTTALYLNTGLSDAFFVSLLVVLIVAMDAVNVRRNVEMQADALNQILVESKLTKVQVVKGHTYMQVAIGAIVGWLAAYIVHIL